MGQATKDLFRGNMATAPNMAGCYSTRYTSRLPGPASCTRNANATSISASSRVYASTALSVPTTATTLFSPGVPFTVTCDSVVIITFAGNIMGITTSSVISVGVQFYSTLLTTPVVSDVLLMVPVSANSVQAVTAPMAIVLTPGSYVANVFLDASVLVSINITGQLNISTVRQY